MNEYISEIDQVLKNGIQLRSSTFQLIRAAFDDEVTAEEIANFRSLIHHTQFPQTLWHHFAFRGHLNLPQEPSAKNKDKNAKYSTIKGFASKTLKNVSKATGIKTKGGKKGGKYLGMGLQPMHGRLSVNSMAVHREEEDGEGEADTHMPSTHNLPTLDSKVNRF